MVVDKIRVLVFSLLVFLDFVVVFRDMVLDYGLRRVFIKNEDFWDLFVIIELKFLGLEFRNLYF